MGESDILRLTVTFDPARVRESLADVDQLDVVQAEENSLRLSAVEASRKLLEIFAAPERAGAQVRDTTMTQPNLRACSSS